MLECKIADAIASESTVTLYTVVKIDDVYVNQNNVFHNGEPTLLFQYSPLANESLGDFVLRVQADLNEKLTNMLTASQIKVAAQAAPAELAKKLIGSTITIG